MHRLHEALCLCLPPWLESWGVSKDDGRMMKIAVTSGAMLSLADMCINAWRLPTKLETPIQ